MLGGINLCLVKNLCSVALTYARWRKLMPGGITVCLSNFSIFQAFQAFRALRAFQAFRVFEAFQADLFDRYMIFDLFKLFSLQKFLYFQTFLPRRFSCS